MTTSSIKHSLQGVQTSVHMGHSIQKPSFDAVRDKNSTIWIGKSPSSQENYKVAQPFGQPYLDQSCELTFSSENDRKSHLLRKTGNEDELVKHMSNLPGFLQRVETENGIQEKALNFGVLEWKHLEKWRYNERMPSKYPKKTSSSSGSSSHRPTSVPPKMVPNLRKQPSSHGLNPSSLSSGKQHVTPDASQFFSLQRQPAPFMKSHLNSSTEEKVVGSHEEVKDVECIMSRGKETCNKEVQAAESVPIDKKQNDFRQKVYNRIGSKTNVETDKKENSTKELISENGTMSSEQGKDKFNLSSHEKHNYHRKTNETRFTEGVNLTSECCTPDLQVPVPKNFSRRSFSGSSQFTESMSPIDAQFAEAIENRFSDCFSPLEHHSGEFAADIAHSCPLDAYVDPASPNGKRGTMNAKLSSPSSSGKPSKKVEHFTTEGRPPSPTGRFRFNLGRMSRSFKESSAVPQLSSPYTAVKSGPVRSKVSSRIDNFERDKSNTSSRGRSSPLRRLLDPLLKYKGAQSAETVRSPNGTLHSMASESMEPMVPSNDRKPEASTFQALLQLTLKNELPFFKLVVDNSSDMLAAVVKRLPMSAKNDSCLTFAFYSVHEVNKESMNWTSKGSKTKSCSLGYSMIGQMKISNSCEARESILYGVDPECVPDKEIAAIVVKNSIQKLSDGENRNCKDTVVVLPGGVHGTPIRGAPSSLLNRWRSGGSCDCGGWDVGCKLRILCDKGKTSNVCDASVPCSAIDRVNLFVQGREHKNMPVLSLEPFTNGFYSIELDTSISMLEAFATSVAYITCQNFSEFLDMDDQSDTTNNQESVLRTSKMKRVATFEGQIPARYVTCPPLSPVGRI